MTDQTNHSSNSPLSAASDAAIPRHVAVIMDGNGRWAQRRGHLRVYGHVRGAARVKEIAKAASEMGVKALTLYAFSTENWKRPESELRVLWKLLKKFLQKELESLHAHGVCLRVFGELDRLPRDVREVIQLAVDRLSGNSGLQLNFALSYGSRREFTRAARLIAEKVKSGHISPEEIDENMIDRFLWTSELGELSEVDLVIRTSGELRVSNFLLWQSAYAEYVFFNECWPDFTAANLRDALLEYSRRSRRFGAVETKRPSADTLSVQL